MLARGHHDRAYLHAGAVHRDQQESDPQLRPVKVSGADQAEDPVGDIGVGGPDLGPATDQVIPVAHGPHLQRGQVRSGLRFGIALAPEMLAGQDAGQIMRLLFRAAMPDQRRSAHRDAHGGQRRCPGQRAFPGKDETLGDAEFCPAMLLGPVWRGPAARVQPALPFHRCIVIAIDAGHPPAGGAQLVAQFAIQKGADFLRKGAVLVIQGQFHPAFLSIASGPVR